jgi:hypothetical protein
MALKIQHFYAAWVFCFTALASAVPIVTVFPLTSRCVSFPGYDNSTGIAGPLRVVADSTGTAIDGHNFVPKYATAVGGGSWGFVRFLPPP